MSRGEPAEWLAVIAFLQKLGWKVTRTSVPPRVMFEVSPPGASNPISTKRKEQLTWAWLRTVLPIYHEDLRQALAAAEKAAFEQWALSQ